MTAFVSHPVICPVMIGHVAELEAIHQRIDGVTGGRGQCVLITGEAGVGKSRLAAEVQSYAAERGFVLLQGTCFPQDTTCPYAPLLDLLRARFTGGTLPATVVERFARELAPLLPDLVPLPAGSPLTVALEPTQQQRRLFDALVACLTLATTAQPVLVLIEDLHWSDESSLDVLLSLLRRAHAQPVLLLGTYRSDEVGPRLGDWLAQLDREHFAQELHLAPLRRDEVAAMLRAIFALPRPVGVETLDAIYSLTEGNPFFVEELLKSLITAGDMFYADGVWDRKRIETLRIPRSLNDAVARRVAQLSTDARHVLALAAVVGRRFDFTLLQRLAQRDEGELVPLLKELIAAQLIVEESADQFVFRHALTRQVISAGLLARERRTLHQTIMDTLERPLSGSLSAAVADLAYHSYAAGMWEQALAYAAQAGALARSLYAPRAAVEQFTRAIEAARQLNRTAPHLYRVRGLTYETLGEFTQAQADLASALELAHGALDQRAEWQALLDLGSLWTSRDYAQSGGYYQQALTLARTIGDPAAVAHSLNQVGNWHVNSERPHEGLQLHREALTIFKERNDLTGLAATLDLLGMAYSQAGDARRAADAYEQAITLLRTLDERYGLSSALTTVALLGGFYFNDTMVPAAPNHTSFVQAGNEALQIARAIDWPAGQAYALNILSGLAGVHGEYGRALQHAQMGLVTAEAIEHRQWMAAAHAMLAALYHDLLALPEARQHGEQALMLAYAATSRFWEAIAVTQLAKVCTDQGDGIRAAAVLDALAFELPAQTFAQRQYWCARAEQALAGGDPRQALDVVDTLLRSATNYIEEWDIPRLAYLRGVALAAVGHAADAEMSFRHAERGAQAQQRTPLRWRLHAALGQLYLAEHRAHDAEREFAAARELVAELAATIADQRLRESFLQSALARLPLAAELSQAVGQTAHDLTPREVEVVRLIAAGKSNQEIAAELVLSVRTVERHISTIYEKLGASGRAARASATIYALRHGLLPPNT
jgi:predicted ATPase/DNA-binding CsgD family transcriptional regulator